MDLSALRNDVLAEIGGNVATFLGHGAITTLGYLLKRPMIATLGFTFASLGASLPRWFLGQWW